MARKEALLRLHDRLVARRDALRRVLSGDLDSLGELSANDAVGDSVDAAVDTANDEINSQLAEIESRELGQIERALQRIGEGEYGKCEFCNEKIGTARLNALPYTTTCIDCQREQERYGPGFFAGSAEDRRWAKVDFRTDEPEDVNLNDFEVDLSESGR